MWHLIKQPLGFLHEPAARVGAEKCAPRDGIALRHFVEQTVRGAEVIGLQRSSVRRKERVPRDDVSHWHGVEEGARSSHVAAAGERREERVPCDHGAGRKRIEKAAGGREAAAAEKLHKRAVVLADKAVGVVHCHGYVRCGRGAGMAVNDGRREPRRPSSHQV
jgi:hypothetical protein